MKKLLLILAALAYIAISCEKPEPTKVDEPNTEQPAQPELPADTSSNPGEIIIEPEDTIAYNADTCQIVVTGGVFFTTFVYNVSSEEVDFEASINSIFKHYTITLKDGTTPAWIGTNCGFLEPYSSDTGSVQTWAVGFGLDSLPYGNYIAITYGLYHGTWGPNYYNPELQCLYHDIVLDEQHTAESIYIDDFLSLFASTPFLSFTKY